MGETNYQYLQSRKQFHLRVLFFFSSSHLFPTNSENLLPTNSENLLFRGDLFPTNSENLFSSGFLLPTNSENLFPTNSEKRFAAASFTLLRKFCELWLCAQMDGSTKEKKEKPHNGSFWWTAESNETWISWASFPIAIVCLLFCRKNAHQQWYCEWELGCPPRQLGWPWR